MEGRDAFSRCHPLVNFVFFTLVVVLTMLVLHPVLLAISLAGAAAYGAFILARQAHVDLTFAWADGPIPEAPAYLLPSVIGDTPMNRSVYLKLIDRVLDARQAQVIRLRYGLEDGCFHPQHEVAKRLGISRSYVSRIEKRALEILKNHME